MSKESKFTAIMARVSEIVDRHPEHAVHVRDIFDGFHGAIVGLGRVSPEIADAMWELLLMFFRKIITASIIGNVDEKAKRYLMEIQQGMTGELAKQLRKKLER